MRCAIVRGVGDRVTSLGTSGVIFCVGATGATLRSGRKMLHSASMYTPLEMRVHKKHPHSILDLYHKEVHGTRNAKKSFKIDAFWTHFKLVLQGASKALFLVRDMFMASNMM